MTAKGATATKTNGQAKPEKKGPAPSTATLLKEEQGARKAWYAHFKGGAPKKPYSPEARASLRALEKAKAALVAATGTANFKDAARSLKYTPQYAPRTRKVAAGK